MRIAFFTTLDNAPWGGSEVLWTKTALHFASKSVDVSCYVPRWKEDPLHIQKLRAAGITVHYYKPAEQTRWERLSSALIKKAGFLRASYFHTLVKERPDYVFFSQGHSYDLGYFPEEMMQEILASSLRYSIICQNNTDYSFIPPSTVRARIDQLYRKAHKVLFVSHRNRETAILHLCREYSNFKVISNSLSISKDSIQALPYPSTKIIHFASVANLKCSHKGQNLLLHVFSQNKWKDRNWQLHFYGKGEDEVYLKELTVFLGLRERVFFHGHNNDVKEIWVRNHILLLASFGEGLPLALQEAMLLGRTAVVTDAGGNSELITNNKTGFLANGTTFSAIDDAIERAWALRFEWEEIGKRAYAFAQSRISLEPEDQLYQLTQ